MQKTRGARRGMEKRDGEEGWLSKKRDADEEGPRRGLVGRRGIGGTRGIGGSRGFGDQKRDRWEKWDRVQRRDVLSW
jgi:hypothetical protein